VSIKVSRLTIDMPVKAHKQLKTVASMMGVTMKDLVIMSIDEFMHRKPNKVTQKAIKQSIDKKNLKQFKTLEHLFDDLGI
jgi:antitoxin component of RelBE/YafQ-DinJ toxin-antitoxin module